MRVFFSLSVAAALAVLSVACNSNESKNSVAGNSGRPATAATPAVVSTNDGVRRITIVELRDAVDKGTAVIVDVRPGPSYQQNHIKGSIHIPLEQFPARIGELPRDKTIVTYCS